MRPSQTIARAGDDSDAAVKPDCHVWNSRCVLLSCPGLTRASIKIEELFEQRWIAGSSPAMTEKT
jgi:hypothetical protein